MDSAMEEHMMEILDVSQASSVEAPIVRSLELTSIQRMTAVKNHPNQIITGNVKH